MPVYSAVSLQLDSIIYADLCICFLVDSMIFSPGDR